MNVVFLFMSQSSAPEGTTSDNWKADKSCGSYYNEHFAGEGYFTILSKLKENGIINNLDIFYESNKFPGKAEWVKNANCQVIPELRFAEKYIKEDTIIFVRGGFKHWHDKLIKYKNKNWLMLYAANTGRQRWEWWDIVLNDLENVNFIDSHERYQHHFIKPIDESMFFPNNNNKYVPYDLCIGASHIHDKKGQWRTIKVLQEYKKLYGIDLNCVMPGSFRRSTNTLEMIPFIEQSNNIELPGMLSRHKLRKVFNQSKFFIHLGQHGQNDRGPLEAMACGTPIILGSPKYHAELLWKDKTVYTPKDIDDYKGIAKNLHYLLENWKPEYKADVYINYKKNLSFDNSYNRMKSLFLMLELLKKPTLKNKERIKSAFDVLDNNKEWEYTFYKGEDYNE